MAVAVGVGGGSVALGVGLGVAGGSVGLGVAVGVSVGGTTGISGSGVATTGVGIAGAVGASVGASATATEVGVGKCEESPTMGKTSRSVGRSVDCSVGGASTTETNVSSGVGVLGALKPGNRTILRGVLV